MSLVLYLKSHCHTLSHFRFSMLFSKSFIVLPFIFRTVNHFKLIFVKGVSSVSRFIFLHVDVQLLQFCLLKGLSFLHSISLYSLVKDHLIVFIGVYFRALYSIGLFVYSSVNTTLS